MLGLGAPELIVILVVILLLFGYKKLPDASRSLGRSLRIFKGEMKGMKDDDAAAVDLRAKEAARTTPVRGEIVTPVDAAAELEAEARAAELRAAELRAQAERARAADGPR
ncbi:Sec-independent protein translocase subunit TatA [Candidatus Blastococcus massiliensis]|uniref:Sec-independent protein translocase subunit TatA n=1 Tax=Candidatus Blastococcus massiliensis TaxID=1470358 RepID=UPI0004BC5756|nr:Sec-independent protein translocase subunit TatA [Candidatus Blastococcus massiliensis]